MSPLSLIILAIVIGCTLGWLLSVLILAWLRRPSPEVKWWACVCDTSDYVDWIAVKRAGPPARVEYSGPFDTGAEAWSEVERLSEACTATETKTQTFNFSGFIPVNHDAPAATSEPKPEVKPTTPEPTAP